jgi:hypothetical protein
MNLEIIDHFPDIFEVKFNSIKKTYREYINMKISEQLKNGIENDLQNAIQNFNILIKSGTLRAIEDFLDNQTDLLLDRHIDILADTM